MILYVLLGTLFLLGVFFLLRWFATADPKEVVRALKWGAAVLIGAFILFLALSGRLAWAIAMIPVLVPWFLRLRLAWRSLKNAGRSMGMGGGGQSSEARTAFLRMTLDHESGAVTGEVLSGRFQGRAVDGLGLAELLELREECRSDDASVQILDAYLDRVHPQWREAASRADGGAAGGEAAGGRAGGGAISRAEALAILGLDEGASDQAIREAHRRLIARLHPDHGGSTYLAAKLNQARDFLLGE